MGGNASARPACCGGGVGRGGGGWPISAGAREVLGLPDPDALRLEDPELLAAYREFLDGLGLAQEGDVVYADPELFCFDSSAETIPGELYPRLRLLAALVNPDDEMVRYVRARTHAPDEFDRRRGRASGHLYPFGVARALEELRRATTAPDHERFREGRAAPACLDHLSMQFSNAPGIMWFADVKIHAWSADWAIVLHYDDAEESPSAAFPKILGFARRDRYPRSAGTLLASMPSYWVYAEAEVEGDNLLSACWMRHGDEGQVSLGELLLRLDDETLDILAGEYGDLGSRSLYEAIEAIREFVCEYWPDQNEHEAVWFAFSRYGNIKDHGGLGALLRLLGEERERLEEEQERQREEEARRREAEERARYEAAPVLAPDFFGAGVTVDRLTEEERRSLRKWMERERGLARSEVTYRQSGGWRRPAGYELTIAFDSGGLRRTASFRAPFPTVAAAFRKALAPAAHGGKPEG